MRFCKKFIYYLFVFNGVWWWLFSLYCIHILNCFKSMFKILLICITNFNAHVFCFLYMFAMSFPTGAPPGIPPSPSWIPRWPEGTRMRHQGVRLEDSDWGMQPGPPEKRRLSTRLRTHRLWFPYPWIFISMTTKQLNAYHSKHVFFVVCCISFVWSECFFCSHCVSQTSS